MGVLSEPALDFSLVGYIDSGQLFGVVTLHRGQRSGRAHLCIVEDNGQLPESQRNNATIANPEEFWNNDMFPLESDEMGEDPSGSECKTNMLSRQTEAVTLSEEEGSLYTSHLPEFAAARKPPCSCLARRLGSEAA